MIKVTWSNHSDPDRSSWSELSDIQAEEINGGVCRKFKAGKFYAKAMKGGYYYASRQDLSKQNWATGNSVLIVNGEVIKGTVTINEDGDISISSES